MPTIAMAGHAIAWVEMALDEMFRHPWLKPSTVVTVCLLSEFNIRTERPPPQHYWKPSSLIFEIGFPNLSCTALTTLSLSLVILSVQFQSWYSF